MSFDKLPPNGTLKCAPYKLNVPQEEVDLFYQLIKLSKLAPKTYENTRTDVLDYGVTHDWMTSTVAHWGSQYNWREREARINSFPHFMTKITDDDGEVYDIHFTGLFSQMPNATPICFLHGWPGSFLEFLGIMDLLRTKYTSATLPYHIVAPSLPGYGLSSGPALKKDFITQDTARIMDKLMVGLGLSGYIGQGGDIGSYTCRPLSSHPGCKGIHLNFSWMPKPMAAVADSEVNDEERAGLAQAKEFGRYQSAYCLEHGTRTATIGFVLSCSPLANLAWIGEKFITWSDTTPPIDEILDSVTLYWFTQSSPRCLYPYRQFHNSITEQCYNIHSDPQFYIKQPLGYSFFPKELAPMPKAWVATSGNLVFHRQHSSGGHFAAMEKPKELWEDIEEYITKAFPIEGLTN